MEDSIISPTNTRVKLLTDEDTSKLVVGILKKIINSNKQLVAVSGVVKDQCSSGSNKEQLEKERNLLSSATSNLQEDTKAAATTTNYKYVKSLLNKTSSVAKTSANLIRLCTTAATETNKDVGIFKKVSTSATTVRDAIFLIVDALMTEVPNDWKDPLAEAIYYDSAKNVEKSLTTLLESKSKLVGENIIPKGNLNEISAAAIASLISAHRIVVEYEYPLTKPGDIVEDVKIAATASSQLWAAFEDSIKQTDLSISHSNLKNGLMNLLDEVKKEYHKLTEEGKKAVIYKAEGNDEMNPNSTNLKEITELKKCVENTTKKINLLLSVAINLSETNVSEIGNQMVEPSPEDQKLATKLLKEAVFKPLPKVPDQKETIKSEGLTDMNIWDEPDNSDNLVVVEDRVKQGSFNKIIERLTSPLSQEIKLMHTFAATYRAFATPQRLYAKLIERFDVPQREEKNRLAIHLRVLNVMKHWCETQFSDFSDDYQLVQALLSFLNETKNNKAYSGIAKSIMNIIDSKRPKSDQQNQLKQQFLEIIELEPKIPLSPSRILFVFNEEEIAKQLTFLDFAIYSQIQPVELLNQAWSKDKLKYRSPNIRKLIARSNAITHWVCSLVLWQKTLKERIKVLTKIINITVHLRKLNNFNSMIGFVSALSTSSINRLKHTLAGLSQETTKTIEELKDLISATSSYSNYRKAIHNSNPPCIPFLGVYLTDLTFIEEGNTDFVTRGENKLINFTKQDLTYNVIHEIQQYQQTPYIFEYYEQLGAFLQQLPCNDEDSLYKLSLLREPKGVPLDQIL